jgi:hypothetical protein
VVEVVVVGCLWAGVVVVVVVGPGRSCGAVVGVEGCSVVEVVGEGSLLVWAVAVKAAATRAMAPAMETMTT